MRNFFIGLGALSLFSSSTTSFGQTPAPPPDSAGWGKTAVEYQRGHRQSPGFIGWSRGQARDSVQAAYIAFKGLRHQFGRFYSNASNLWYVLSTSFGDREGESRFVLVTSPRMDEPTFRDDFPYWHDRNGVYYARLSYYQQTIFLIAAADPTMFRSLNFQRLAVDKKHVFEGGNVVPGLSPLNLHVYTPNGEQYGLADVSERDSYLVSGQTGYRPDGRVLTKYEVLHFQPPAPYKLAYPLPVRQVNKR